MNSYNNPESCGCCVWSDGRLYQPATCHICGGNLRWGCGSCKNTGLEWEPCPHYHQSNATRRSAQPAYTTTQQ
ncbi:Putative protein of unknown function [Podospora comata]|uniref:IBR domain-containing protein n=1 Tax=Podospora comata TaxID=48703 RepID=A0ABY6S4J1_PODCO|nr:Putative protein of unknown function [Podospora comata]